DRLGIEARRFRERHREDRAEAVNDVVGEEKRDAQSRFLDRNALEAARVRGAMHTQEGADAPRAHVLFAAGTLGRPCIRARPARFSWPSFSSSVISARIESTSSSRRASAARWRAWKSGR